MLALNLKKETALLILVGGIILASGLAAFLPPVFLIAFLTAVFLFALAFKKIEYGVLLLAAYTPFEPFILKFASEEIYPLARYGPEFFLLILFLALLVKLVPHNQPFWIKTPINRALLIFIIITALSMIINFVSPLVWLLGLRQILRYVALFYLIIYLRPDKKFAKQLLTVLFAIIIIQSVIGLGQALIGTPADQFLLPAARGQVGEFAVPDKVEQFWESGQRVFATLGRYDRLGTFLCFFMLLAFGFFFKKDKKVWPVFLIIFALPVLILTYSRMSWLGLVLGAIIIGVLIQRNKKVIASLIVLAIMLAAYLGLYVAANNLNLKRLEDQPQMALAERILELASPNSWRWSYRGYGRQYFIVHTITDVVKEKPLLGFGLGQYGSGVAAATQNKEVYDELGLPFGIQGVDGQIDNNWFSLWGEVGALGVLAWLAILVSLYFYCFKVYKNTQDDFIRNLALGYLGAMPVICWQAFLGPYFEVRTISLYLWLFGGLIVNFGLKEGIGKKALDPVRNLKSA